MLTLSIILCALGCGLVAGVFFAFSTFVMKALGALQPAQGIAAMQSINIVVINPWFMTAFFGTALLCIAQLIAAVRGWQESAAPYLLAGSLVYLIGVILVTGLSNVPRNNALAAVSPSSAEGAALWTDYLSIWTMWNHVRTIASLTASALFISALLVHA